jgi:putative transposase
MARIARLVVPGYPHHITQRGSRRQTTFFSRADYRLYLDLVIQAKEEAGVEFWGYCLMPNHVHAVVVPQRKDSLAELFRTAHSEYARRINRREGWQGHLWQERFHSFVLNEDYLLATVRYVELNPVRAGMCSKPVDWRWSSVHAHIRGSDDNIVTVRPMLDRIADWRLYLQHGNSMNELEKIRQHSRNGLPAGDDEFVNELERHSGRTLRSPKRGRPPKKLVTVPNLREK